MKGRNKREGCEEGMGRKWRQRTKGTDDRKDGREGCMDGIQGRNAWQEWVDCFWKDEIINRRNL
jgi:hypothetical protein